MVLERQAILDDPPSLSKGMKHMIGSLDSFMNPSLNEMR
jgi:hypothetical protein